MTKLLRLNLLHRITPKLPVGRHFTLDNNKKSPGRHGYHEDVEQGVNKQIQDELIAGYTYLAISTHFGRADIALPGCHAFFLKMYFEEQEHAFKLIEYQNMRSGRVNLCQISIDDQNWKSVCDAFNMALQMEQNIKVQLEKLLCVAEQHKDTTTVDLMSSFFIPEQDRSICEMTRLLTRASRVVEGGIGEYLFDRSLHDAYVIKDKGSKLFGVSEAYK